MDTSTEPSEHPAAVDRASPLTLPVVLVSVVLVAMSIAGTAVALPSIGRDLDASGSPLHWVVAGYNLAFAAMTLVAGSAADRIGRRRVFVAVALVFVAGFLATALSRTIIITDLARIVSGVGGAGLMAAGVGIAIGPTLSGLSRTWKKELEERRRAIEKLEHELTGCIGCGCLSMKACLLLNPDDALRDRGPGPYGSRRPPRPREKIPRQNGLIPDGKEAMFAISLGDDGAELRPLEPWRAEEFLNHMDRGREFIGRFISLPDLVTDLESARSVLRTYADKAAADIGRIYGIWVDGKLVGGVLFRTMDIKHGTAEAGCWLEPSAAGKGLVTRAIRVIIDWAVEERGIHRVEWQAAAGNTASIAVARRIGMTRDGVLRESYPHRGERHDVEVWSVLAPEWRANRQKT